MRLFVVAAVLVLGAAPARAQKSVAKAEVRFDVDGDGKDDVVLIDEAATVSVVITGASSAAPWKAFRTTGEPIRKASLEVRRFGKHTVIWAEATFGRKRATAPKATEVMALEWKRGTLGVLVQETVGPQGRDGEWSKHIALTDQGLIRYQGRPGVTRCDGKPAYLFLERYDFKRDKFRRAAMPVLLPDAAPALAAKTGARPVGKPVAFRFAGVSIDAQATSAADLIPPRELEDADPTTAWTGFGRGQFATARQRSDFQVRAIRVVASGVKEIVLLLGNQAYRVPLSRTKTEQWIDLDPPVSARCVTIVVSKVGKRAAIAELGVLTELELSADSGAGLLAKRVAAGKQVATAVNQLAALGERGMHAAVAEIPGSNDRGAHRLRVAIVSLAVRKIPLAQGALEQLVLGCGNDRTTPSELRSCETALRAMGMSGVAAAQSLAVDDKASRAARIMAIDVIGKVADAQAQSALIGFAGTGPRWRRKQVTIALGRRDPSELSALVAAATAATDISVEADLWRAVGALAPRAEARGAALEAMAKRLADAKDYELRYRLAAALGTIEDDAAVAALAALLEQPADDARAIAVRRIAVAALGRNPHPRAETLIASIMADTDPGLRIAAVEALADRPTLGEPAETGLIARLSDDKWPRARRAAAGALGIRCGRPPVAAALYSALENDDDFGVLTTALNALVGCDAPNIGDTLVAVASDSQRDAQLRSHAIRLLGQRGESACGALGGIYKAARKDAWSEQRAIGVAASALAAMSTACPDGAAESLLGAGQDDAFPVLQTAAIEGLARTCPRGATAVLRRAARLDQRQVRDAAKRALRRCRR